MNKLCIFVALFAYASAGIIPIDDGIGYGGIALAPRVATVAVKAGATSYQNSNLLSIHPTAVVTKAVAAPIAAPIITKVAAPIAYASPVAPAVSVVSLGHDGLGGLGGYGGYGGYGSYGGYGGYGDITIGKY